MFIDLQTHTTASDGRLTPTQLVKKAKKLGIFYLAKTDHDNADLTAEFLTAGKKFGVKAIPGIEISSHYKNKSLHILGLGIDYKNKHIINYAKKVAAVRKQRAIQMVKKLEKAGWKIKKSEIQKKVIARPHIANTAIKHKGNKKRLIAEFGSVPHFSAFIKKYLIKNTPCFVPKPFHISPVSAIDIIKNAGGLALISHPLSKSPEFSFTKKHLLDLIKLNFDGLEVYSPIHSLTEIKYLNSLVKKYNLLASAGSDYHGYDNMQPLGICNNGKYADEKICAELLKRLN